MISSTCITDASGHAVRFSDRLLAKMKTPDYVEFVAWNGSVEERVNRAVKAVAAASGPDKEFADWLCLRENVDRFE